MQLEVYGGSAAHRHYSGHGEHEPGVDPELKPCPFCGGTDIEVANTHTPYYTATCITCGAEGPNGEPDGYDGRHIRTKKRAVVLHRQAFQRAIDEWNTRA